MIRLLTGDGRGLTVVGDDDQSIYAWRGARPRNLSRLGSDFPDLTLIKLEQNYRSSGRILGAANHLIRHNARHFDKNLWSALGHGDPIRVVVADSEQNEAERTVAAIMRHQFQSRGAYGDYAILYRGNHQARELEIRLREMRIPYRISGGSSFFDRGEIRDIMAYLRLLSNPADDSALLRIINTPRRGIGSSTLEALSQLARQRGEPLFTVLGDTGLADRLKPRQAETLRRFAERLGELAAKTDAGNAADTVRELVDFVGYRRWLRENNEATVADRRWDNVCLLLDWIERPRWMGKPGARCRNW